MTWREGEERLSEPPRKSFFSRLVWGLPGEGGREGPGLFVYCRRRLRGRLLYERTVCGELQTLLIWSGIGTDFILTIFDVYLALPNSRNVYK